MLLDVDPVLVVIPLDDRFSNSGFHSLSITQSITFVKLLEALERNLQCEKYTRYVNEKSKNTLCLEDEEIRIKKEASGMIVGTYAA